MFARAQIVKVLDEQQRRWYVAVEADRIGYGGLRLLSQITPDWHCLLLLMFISTTQRMSCKNVKRCCKPRTKKRQNVL